MSPEPTLPAAVVIGAQKCGTTTLYEDLRQHPDIILAEKESSGLLDPGLLTPSGRRRYRSLFPRLRPGAVAVDVATTYAMLPVHDGVAERAHALEPDLQVFYIVRDPLRRVVSHHHHDLGLGLCGPDIDDAVREHAPLVDNTRYATQVRPWVEAFGRERIHVIRFEDYVADRSDGVAQVHRALGLPLRPLARTGVHNASSERRVPRGAWRTASTNPVYRRVIRPLIPRSARGALMRNLLPQGPARPRPPSAPTVSFLVEALGPEVAALAELVGGRPLWDITKTADAICGSSAWRAR